VIINFQEIKKEVFNHYKNLYIEEGEDNVTKREEILAHVPRLVTFEDNNALNNHITRKEIIQAICELDPEKAPGLDEYTIHFYQACWPIIKKDLCRMIYKSQFKSNIG
jgi:hypothetical protein